MDDFHIHSTYSDGLDSINNLIQKAKDFTMFSITDHNNIEASKKIRENNFITGVELSTYFLKDEYYILGYNFDANNIKIDPDLIDILIKQDVTLNKVSITKIISKELNNKDFFEIYDRYVKSYYQNIKYYSMPIRDIIKNIKNANGYLILAHPFISFKNMDPKTIVGKFLMHGGDGIEITPNSIDKSMEIIDYYDTIYSIGSDYHSNRFNRNNTIGIDTKYFDNDKRYLKNVIRRN